MCKDTFAVYVRVIVSLKGEWAAGKRRNEAVFVQAS